MPHPEKVDLLTTAQSVTKYWSQKIIGNANGSLFKLVRGKGSTNWHSHDHEDEVFVVLEGTLTIKLRDRDITLSSGELFVVPKGVEHCPEVCGEKDALLLVIGKTVTSTREGGKPAWSF